MTLLHNTFFYISYFYLQTEGILHQSTYPQTLLFIANVPVFIGVL